MFDDLNSLALFRRGNVNEAKFASLENVLAVLNVQGMEEKLEDIQRERICQ